jgi:superfamily II DNA or RNA helicase
MVLTEGWDQPDVSCIVLARPTKHMGLYRQMCGRVLRPAPGKADALVIDHSGAIFEHGFVEEPVEWTLDKDSRVAVPTQALRAAGLERKLVVCPECGAVRRQGAPCPACGWRPVVKSRAVVPAEGELDRVARDRSVAAEALSAEHRASFHAQLAWIAEERGYKPGWAAYKYKERFGNWPLARHVEPQLPADTTRSWVRSRQIAWAKAKEAQDSPRRAEPATYNLKVGGERI